MDKESMVEMWKWAIEEYDEQIKTLETERRIAKLIILRLSSNGQTEIKEIVLDPHSVKIGPTQAIKELFDSNPEKKWRAPELRDKLQNMKESGVLETKAKNLLTTVYYLLKRLEKDYIKKDTSGAKTLYQKIEQE